MAASTEIQIANITNFEKIQNFLNDSAYKEILENSENFNTRLCIERRLRMPFLDPQTGVAQNHCALFMSKRQRLPGFRDGQIYTYPSSRWRKSKRQYLLHHQSYKAFQFRETHYQHHHHPHQSETGSAGATDSNSLTAVADNDSKDSHRNDEETKWYHDEMDLNHFEDFEEDFDSDLDFDESYNKTRRKKGHTKSRKGNTDGISTPVKRGRGRGGGRGRGRGDGEGRRGRVSNASSTIPPPSLSTNNSSSASNPGDDIQMPVLTPEQKMSPGEDSSDGQPLSLLAGTATLSAQSTNSTTSNTTSAFNLGTSAPSTENTVAATGGGSSSTTNTTKSTKTTTKQVRNERGKAQPSPYCDFCLGDARENKKTNLPEELVSCSDCGRSGHPTCLQFTPNMIVSVKRYHWQCIECKYCSICGTSDNDDQLLFCDDCDRGYHMYCLQPPLTTPPEGSWSCKLCLEEFHGVTNRRKRGRPKKLFDQFVYY